MNRSLFIGIVLIGLLTACSGGGSGVADMKVLNIDDLQKDYRASKDEARKKYHGKEFVVLGKADLSPISEYALKSEDGKFVSYTVRATEPGGMTCWIPVEDKSKFDGLVGDAVVAVKGTIEINDGNFAMRPCNRDFRENKK